MNIGEIIEKFEELADPEQIEGMARFGINPKNTYALRMPVIKKIAKEAGKSHELAIKLWEIDTRETRIMASLVDIPKEVTSKQMDQWVNEFDYWEICDQCCINLFRKTEFAYTKVFEWTKNDKEFVKRAGFVLIAVLAVHDKKADDDVFIELLPIIKRESTDGRKLVKKAVNWALRQIGKRNLNLNKIAIDFAIEIDKIDSKSAHWIAKDVIRELTSDKVQKRLKMRKNR
ncbi:DNA alkylation repair enzyme [Methanobrevibacter cuticularis]|uniref:DNA alkylation repair enzyme n=1 Tax=Methanobrevibacter cuticularis TaxID=47311 RepID=A0A166EKW3_9EURY|nr:DNA alkylation repair protein [Methanobrevibacter cuticularis]KZX16769.1 DNA alkylation repair enzyme [Methanobrevibacter cuticularis]